MSAKAEKLVRMANQIAGFFASYPEKEAIVSVRDHLHAFWTPGMIDALTEHAASHPEGLHPLALAALTHPAG